MTPHAFDTPEQKAKRILYQLIGEYPDHAKKILNDKTGIITKLEQLEKLINSPEVNDFLKGVQIEAAHQVQRWGIKNEESSPPHHFILVFAKLLGKMSTDVFDRDAEKFKHHCIAVAAEMHNIHRQIDKEGTAINHWFYQRDGGN